MWRFWVQQTSFKININEKCFEWFSHLLWLQYSTLGLLMAEFKNKVRKYIWRIFVDMFNTTKVLKNIFQMPAVFPFAMIILILTIRFLFLSDTDIPETKKTDAYTIPIVGAIARH